ncbi:MAG: RDD family protein [Acidimicrobiales bacterium]|nr:RDD family protein [Acidimicrobiales bacterium]
MLGRPLATWGQRAGALLIDTLVVSIPGAIVVGIVSATTSTTIMDPFNGNTHRYVPAPFNLAWAVILAFEVIYFAALDGQSQTVGKRVLGIAVRAQGSGQPIGFGRALGRWLIYVGLFYLLLIPGVLNALSPLWDGKRQAWHDHAVGSVVVSLK